MAGYITEKQEEILNFIKDQILKKGYPPAVREICEAVHLKSTSSVHSHLESLEKNGYIRRDPTKPRAIEIIDEDFLFNSRREMAQIPIIGRVAAGVPILAEQNIEGYFPLPADMLPNCECFILDVQGESMKGMGILDGDSVLCAKTNVANNGEVVVALVDDSATVKRFYKEKGTFRLQPENPDFEPIISDEITILGKVIAVIRYY